MTSPTDPERPIRELDRTHLFDRRPHVQRLGNGRYTVLITNAGGGHSECDGIALTRSRADPVEDGDGWFCYLRDLDTARYWSIGYQPTGGEPERYEVQLAPDWARIRRQDAGIEATLTVALAPGDPLEIRRCSLENRSSRPRRIELTSYLEPVLQAAAADAAHPAFSKLFVQTEAAPEQRALLATRRPRGADEPGRWLAHWLIEDGGRGPVAHYETDRQRFIGRGRSLAAPAALATDAALSGTVGNVLDPILSLRRVVELAPGERRTLAFGLGFAATRAAALGLAANHTRLADLAQILERVPEDPTAETAATPAGTVPSIRYQPASAADPSPEERVEELAFDNGIGGFAAGGHEYVMRITPAQRPPLPWTHVVANQSFGFITSESGAGSSWSRNSRENRLTPWYNDPVSDPHGEALYLRDEDALSFWSPTPGPVPALASTTVRYGFGYCRFLQTSAQLEQEVCQFVPRADPLKVTGIRLTNLADRRRRLSVFAYARLVLGGLPSETAGSIETSLEAATGALLARNPKRGTFSKGVAFAATVAPTGAIHHRTADRTGFIGRNGSPARPAALLGAAALDGRTGKDLDPCFALQVELELAPGETAELAFLLGEGADAGATRALIKKYASLAAIDQAFDEVCALWRDVVSAVADSRPRLRRST